MIIKYINSAGIEVNLNKNSYRMLLSDILDYEWEILESANKIIGFGKKISRKDINVDVLKKEKNAREKLNELTEVFEYDVLNMSPGKLYIDKFYLSCFFIKSKKENWETDTVISCTFGLATDYPFWIKETFYQFHQQQIPVKEPDIQYPVVSGGIYSEKALENQAVLGEFPFDFARPSDIKIEYPMFGFPFDFVATSYGRRTIENPSFADSNFILTIYGFADNPSVMINGHPYTVYATIYEGERLVINSVDRTVLKIGRLGEVSNLYNSREKVVSVFQKIKPGAQVVTWPGSYGIDLTLLDERSEPKWSF